MCGLTGFITDSSKSYGAVGRGKYMKQTLVADTLRGFHATGVFYSLSGEAKEGDVTTGYAKACVTGGEFVLDEDYALVEGLMPYLRYCVGHNRWATTGATDDVENAHPFLEGDITLVHNGTLDGDGGLKTSQTELDVDVDSHAICHNLAIHDAKDVIEDLDGAFCLIWHDKRNNSLNFVRNSDRPLWMYTDPSLDTVFFGSERKMMEWILDRNNIGRPAQGMWKMLPVGEVWTYIGDTIIPVVEKVNLSDRYDWKGYGGGGGGYKYSVGKSQSRTTTTVTSGTSNLVSGNDKRLVSDGANELLNTEGWDRSDRLPFIAHSRNGSLSIGTVASWNVPAFLVGVTAEQFNANFEHKWLVAPIGIRMVTHADGSSQAVLMCRKIGFSYYDSDWRYGSGFTEVTDVKKPQGEILALPQPDPLVETFPVLGTTVEREEWFAATREGCGVCSQVPAVAIADHITWLDDGRGSFLCPMCADNVSGNKVTA